MKRKRWILAVLFLVGFMIVCAFLYPEPEPSSFSGTILQINGESALIDIEEGVILRSGNRVRVHLSKREARTLQVGDRVRVEYRGAVRESYPLQISKTKIEWIP